MSYEKDLDDIEIEMERIYRRAMEASLEGLTPDQALAIKKLQFDAKEQKENRALLTPSLKDGYRLISAALRSNQLQREQLLQAQKLKAEMEAEINERWSGLQHVSSELEKALGTEP